MINAHDDMRCVMIRVSKCQDKWSPSYQDIWHFWNRRKVPTETKVIFVRPIHFYPEYLQTSNRGPWANKRGKRGKNEGQTEANSPVLLPEDVYCIHELYHPIPRAKLWTLSTLTHNVSRFTIVLVLVNLVARLSFFTSEHQNYIGDRLFINKSLRKKIEVNFK